MLYKRKRLSLQLKIMALSIAAVCVALMVGGGLVVNGIYQQVVADMSERAFTIGRGVANDPLVNSRPLTPEDSARVQPFAEQVRHYSGAAFIVVANMDKIRIAHPLPDYIGLPVSDLYRDPVMEGHEFHSVDHGLLETTLRGYVPIFAADGSGQIGFVSVGFYLDDIYAQVLAQAQNVLYGLLAAWICSMVGAWLLAKNIKKAIFGLEPHEIATLLREKEAMLDALKEGLVAVDSQGRIRFFNQWAASYLGDDFVGKPLQEYLPQLPLEQVLQDGKALYDLEQRLQGIIILANIVPVVSEGESRGLVITFRDRTEMTRLAEEMTGIHQLIELLRAQAHEFKNKMHAVAGLIQLGETDEAVNLLVEQDQRGQETMLQLQKNIKNPIIFGLLLGKYSRARELGVTLEVKTSTLIQRLPDQLTNGDLVIILGNLLENALEAAVNSAAKRVEVFLENTAEALVLEVYNTGDGIAEEIAKAMYQKGFSSKGGQRGYGLALTAEKVAVNRGTISHENVPGGVLFRVALPHKS